MGKMKQVYMDLWEQQGGDIPPDYDLAGYLAKQKTEYELELRKDAEALEAFERETDQQNDDSVHDNGSSKPEA
jgi:hypothetical protein